MRTSVSILRDPEIPFRMHQNKLNRRQAIGTLVLGTVALPALTQQSQAMAPKLEVNDPEAVKLNYIEDAAKVDAKHFPNYKSGQTCANCQFIELRYGFYRPCKLFPGKVVSAKGWCSSWVANTFNK